MTLRALICCFGAIAGLGGLQARPATEAETRAFLEKLASSRSGEARSVSFREVRKLALLQEPVVETGTLRFKPPAFFRKETGNPVELLNVSDGKTLWVVFPQKNEAEKYPLQANRALRDSFFALSTAFNLSDLEKQFSVSGEWLEDGFRLLLVPRKRALKEGLSSVGVRLDLNGGLKEIEVNAPNGNRTVFYLSDERKIQDSAGMFVFTPPPGMKVSTPLGE
jgi:chaperone LolA